MTDEEGTNQGQQSNPMAMGMEMMKRMMGQMREGGGSPMEMMQTMMAQHGPAGGKPPMEQMMGMCMGMCSEMLATMQRTTALATFATPELRKLFQEWLDGLEGRALELVRDSEGADAGELAQELSISEEGAAYLLAHLAQAGKIKLRAELAG